MVARNSAIDWRCTTTSSANNKEKETEKALVLGFCLKQGTRPGTALTRFLFVLATTAACFCLSAAPYQPTSGSRQPPPCVRDAPALTVEKQDLIHLPPFPYASRCQHSCLTALHLKPGSRPRGYYLPTLSWRPARRGKTGRAGGWGGREEEMQI